MAKMAYEDSNVAQLVEDEFLWMGNCSYSGDSKFYDFEKHKRKWFDCKHVLEKHNEMPRIDRFIKMFLNSISDDRLAHEKVQLLKPGSAGLKDFTACTTQLSHVLGISKVAAARPTAGKRNISSAESSSRNGNNNGGQTPQDE